MKIRELLRRSFSQTGVLVALAIFTVAVPLTGFVGADTTLAVPGRDVVVAGKNTQSWSQTEAQVSDQPSEQSGDDTNQAGYDKKNNSSQDAAADGSAADGSSADGSSKDENATEEPAVTSDDFNAVPAALAKGVDAQAKVRITAAQEQPLPSCDAKKAARGEASMRGNTNENVIYWPLTKGVFRMASPFGYRVHPVYHVGRLHAGVDMSAPAMTPVHAAAAGKVVFVGPWGGGGNIVRIEHKIGKEHFFTQYLHLTTGSAVVKVGDQVKAGQHIAGVGTTGTSTGNHLHFEVRPTMDTPVDPVKWLNSHAAVYLGQETC